MPSGFWKIVALEMPGPRVAAFIMGQDTAKASPLMDHLTTVDEVERRIGLDFF